MALNGSEARQVLRELRKCAAAWEAEVCLVGNVRAGDIVRALDRVFAPDDAELARAISRMTGAGRVGMRLEGRVPALHERLQRDGMGEAMTVAELIAQLQRCPPNMAVCVWDVASDDDMPVTHAYWEDGTSHVVIGTGEIPVLVEAEPESHG